MQNQHHQQHPTFHSNSAKNCVIHLRDDTIGDGNGTTLKPIPIMAPLTLQQFRSQLHLQGLADVSSIIECDSNGQPLRRGMMMTLPNDILQLGRHYIVRRDVLQPPQAGSATDPSNNTNNSNNNGGSSGSKGVTFSSMATVREFSLSFVSQSPMHTTAAGGISSADLRSGSSAMLPPGFGVASLFSSHNPNTFNGANNGNNSYLQQQQNKFKFPLFFQHDGATHECGETEFRQMLQRDFVGEARALGQELDSVLRTHA